MPNAASAWQLRLQSHFATLAAKSNICGRPIFAIEHGLNSAEIDELQSVARTVLALDGLRSDHWLLWVVYAAEYGYRFDGLQFWEDFSEQTPNWYLKGDRKRIRDWFRRFQSDFGGIVPRGRWASHFSIISWPITHAILPKDLQRRLARALYEGQYELRRVAGCPLDEIGRALANTVHEGSQRFLLFLEQEELVGQIVVSLLGSTDEASAGIEPTALSRISHDLSAMRDARDWIKQAQKTWRSRGLQFRVAGTIDRRLDLQSPFNSDKPAALHTISLMPTIEAQQVPGGVWRLELTIPSFGDIAALDPQFRDFLRTTRVSVPMAGTPMLPGGWLLVGVRKRILKSWPVGGEGLLRFETPPPFEGHVDWELSLPNSKVWIFKIQNGGVGRFMRGNQVRAGCSYLVFVPINCNLDVLGPGQKCECDGTSVFRLDLPTVVQPSLRAQLEAVGLQCVQSITLSVVGNPPLQWDAIAGAEWLSSSRPMLSIECDHQVEAYQLSLNDSDMIEVPGDPTQPVLFELPALLPGTHNLSIQALTTHRGHDVVTKRIRSTLQFRILIRDPKPWVSGDTNYPGMFVSYAPLNPSIEDFLAGHVSLDVLGESDVCSTISIVLKNSIGEQVLKRVVMKHALPISHETWKHSYRLFLQDSVDDSEFYACNTAYLDILSSEFGSYRINLERQFAPLRWLLTHKDGAPSMRLIEHGSGEGIHASFSDFRSVLVDVPFTQTALQHGFVIGQPGGLFRAAAGEMSTDAIYAPTDIKGGLAALHVPFENAPLATVNDFSAVLERAAIWHKAKPLTYLAKLWQRQLIKLLFDQVIGRYCGRRWIEAEHELNDRPKDDARWESLESRVGDNLTYGIAVGKTELNRNSSFNDLKARLFDVTRRHKISIDDSALDLAWKLAWFEDLYEPLSVAELEVVGLYGRVIRAARLMRLRSIYGRFSLTIEGGR